MKHPTAEQLTENFRDLNEEEAALAVALCEAVDDGETLEDLIDSDDLPKTYRYLRALHSSPFRSAKWRRTLVLAALDELVETHGVEAYPDDEYATCDYLNAGDPYATTLLYDRAADEIRIGCWGDLAEALSA